MVNQKKDDVQVISLKELNKIKGGTGDSNTTITVSTSCDFIAESAASGL